LGKGDMALALVSPPDLLIALNIMFIKKGSVCNPKLVLLSGVGSLMRWEKKPFEFMDIGRTK
jgi:hypothetical protein